jgi:hypothetical protein
MRGRYCIRRPISILEVHDLFTRTPRDSDEGGYAFVDSFSLEPPYGQDENFGIDVGPMLLAIENVRTGLIWKLFIEHDSARPAVKRSLLATTATV